VGAPGGTEHPARSLGNPRGHGDHSSVTARRAVDPDHRSRPGTSRREPLPAPDRHQTGQAADPGRNPQAEAAVERLKEKLDQAQAKRARESEGEAARPQIQKAVAQADPRRSESESSGPVAGRDPETGRFREGHQKLGGRVAGSKDQFPRNSYRAMKELIAGRILKVMKDQEGQEVQKSPAEIMADAILEGMQGKLVVTTSRSGSVTYANPLYAVKLFHDYMVKSRELALKLRDAKKKDEGTGGGIRIVLPSVPADPLLKPGQKPRPLRLLGQDPSKPLPAATGTATDAQPSPGPVPTQADGARKSANIRSTPPAITSPVSAAQSTDLPCPCAKLRRRFGSRRADRGL